jgi:putative flippase GtrA
MSQSSRPTLSAVVAREERARAIRFAVVGGSSTLITLLTYAVLEGVGTPYALAATLGYAAGILNGYTWNRLWTFETGPFHLPEFFRYVVVQGSGLVANLLGLVLLVEALHLDKLLAEILSVVPIVLVTYLFNRWWTFRRPPRAG